MATPFYSSTTDWLSKMWRCPSRVVCTLAPATRKLCQSRLRTHKLPRFYKRIEVTGMNFYYSLNAAEQRPDFIGNFNSFHRAEEEIWKLLNGSSGVTDGYLFLHRSALSSTKQCKHTQKNILLVIVTHCVKFQNRKNGEA